MRVTTEEYKDWADRQGGEAVTVGDWVLFPSGARCTTNDSVRMELPPGRRRLKGQRAYWEERRHRVLRDLKVVRAVAVGVSDPVKLYTRDLPADPKQAIRQLEELAEKCRNEMESVERQLRTVTT